MTNRIGHKQAAQQAGKADKKTSRRLEEEREAIKQELAAAHYRNTLMKQPEQLFLPPA